MSLVAWMIFIVTTSLDIHGALLYDIEEVGVVTLCDDFGAIGIISLFDSIGDLKK